MSFVEMEKTRQQYLFLFLLKIVLVNNCKFTKNNCEYKTNNFFFLNHLYVAILMPDQLQYSNYLFNIQVFKIFTYYSKYLCSKYLVTIYLEFPPNKNSLLYSIKTFIKIGKITLIYFYHLILRLCSSSSIVLTMSRMIQYRIKLCIWLSYFSCLLQPGRVSRSFIDFNDSISFLCYVKYYHIFSSLKQHTLVITVPGGPESRHSLAGFSASGSHQAATSMSATAVVSEASSGKDLFLSFPRLLAQFSSSLLQGLSSCSSWPCGFLQHDLSLMAAYFFKDSEAKSIPSASKMESQTYCKGIMGGASHHLCSIFLFLPKLKG